MARTKRADEAPLLEALTHLPDSYLMCRDVRHAWDVSTDYYVTASKGTRPTEIQRTLTCLRCGTLRVERYLPTRNAGLDKVGQTYRYPGARPDDERPRYQFTEKGITRGNKPSSLIQGEAYRRSLERQAGSRRGEHLRAV